MHLGVALAGMSSPSRAQRRGRTQRPAQLAGIPLFAQSERELERCRFRRGCCYGETKGLTQSSTELYSGIGEFGGGGKVRDEKVFLLQHS